MRLMELNTTADLRTVEPKRDDGCGEPPHGQQNSCGIGASMKDDLSAILMRKGGERRYLEGKDRKDAGHQVQDDAAKKGHENDPQHAGGLRIVVIIERNPRRDRCGTLIVRHG